MGWRWRGDGVAMARPLQGGEEPFYTCGELPCATGCWPRIVAAHGSSRGRPPHWWTGRRGLAVARRPGDPERRGAKGPTAGGAPLAWRAAWLAVLRPGIPRERGFDGRAAAARGRNGGAQRRHRRDGRRRRTGQH